MAKSTKIIAALGVAAGLGVAAMPLASYAASTPATFNSIEDKIEVEVPVACKISAEDPENTGTFSDSINATYHVELTNSANNDSIATHNFKIACNNTDGYEVKAQATDLAVDGTNDKIEFVSAGSYDSSKKDTDDQGKWTAAVNDPDTVTFNAIARDTKEVVKKNLGATDVKNDDTFSVTYKAYTGKKTPSGTYEGTVTYTLYTPAGA